METTQQNLAGLEIGTWIDVDPLHCHKRRPENTLVSKLRVTSEDRVHAELRLKFDYSKLPFFFDHEIDHIPGMLGACGLRQCALALAHLVYGVPLDFVMVISWLKLDMYNFGELDIDTIVESTLLDMTRSATKISIGLRGVIMQEKCPIMQMSGMVHALHPRLAKRMRHRKTQPASLVHSVSF